MSRRTKRNLILGFCAFSVVACAEEDTRLFDETGTWSLIYFSLEGGALSPIEHSPHNNAFLLNFDPSVSLVTAAACSFGGSNSVLASQCRFGDENQIDWECRCFKYSYEGSTMNWTEYAPGTDPPASAGGGGDTDGGGAEGSTTITVSVPDSEDLPNGSKLFTPLPGPSEFDMVDGVFQSDGETSSHVFLQRAENLIDETGCRAACGFPGDGGETGE
jgi:hypothetical protein